MFMIIAAVIGITASCMLNERVCIGLLRLLLLPFISRAVSFLLLIS